MAVNTASNMGAKRRRRRKPKTGIPADAFQRARAVGLRRQGRAPASDARRTTARITRPITGPPRPVGTSAPRTGSATALPKPIAAMRSAAKARAGSAPTTTPVTPPTTTSAKPAKPFKPAVPAGQPKAYGARRKATLPPGLAKRTAGVGPMPRPPKPKKAPASRRRTY
jgi:hypothetical protein